MKTKTVRLYPRKEGKEITNFLNECKLASLELKNTNIPLQPLSRERVASLMDRLIIIVTDTMIMLTGGKIPS